MPDASRPDHPRPDHPARESRPASPSHSVTPALVVVRSFAAPVAQVFAAWTDPALLHQWLAPDPCVVLEATADARPGGRYRVVVASPGGDVHVTTGEYREVVPDARLVKTWVYEGPNVPSGQYPTLLTVEFRVTGPSSTEITLRQEGLIMPDDRAGNREGWRLCFAKLDALLAARSSIP